jgi:hypothetical protein
MIKRPSFPVYRVVERPSRRSFDRRLTVVTLVLAVIVVAALLVRAAGPIPETPSDPDTFAVGP